MSLVDLLFLIVMFLSAWGGWSSGFIYGAIGLILWVGSLAAAFYLYPDLVRPLTHMAPGPVGYWSHGGRRAWVDDLPGIQELKIGGRGDGLTVSFAFWENEGISKT